METIRLTLARIKESLWRSVRLGKLCLILIPLFGGRLMGMDSNEENYYLLGEGCYIPNVIMEQGVCPSFNVVDVINLSCLNKHTYKKFAPLLAVKKAEYLQQQALRETLHKILLPQVPAEVWKKCEQQYREDPHFYEKEKWEVDIPNAPLIKKYYQWVKPIEEDFLVGIDPTQELSSEKRNQLGQYNAIDKYIKSTDPTYLCIDQAASIQKTSSKQENKWGQHLKEVKFIYGMCLPRYLCQYFSAVEKLELSPVGNFKTLAIPREIETLHPTLKKLWINNYPDLHCFRKEIYKLLNLESLDIFGCGFARLDENFTQLAKLRRVSFQLNKFTEIPAVLKKLPHLKFLLMSENQITKLPSLEEGDFQALEQLILHVNQIEEVLEAFATLPKIKILRLARNQIKRIAWEKVSPTLKEVDISYNLQLTEISPASKFPAIYWHTQGTALPDLPESNSYKWLFCGIGVGVVGLYGVYRYVKSKYKKPATHSQQHSLEDCALVRAQSIEGP